MNPCETPFFTSAICQVSLLLNAVHSYYIHTSSKGDSRMPDGSSFLFYDCFRWIFQVMWYLMCPLQNCFK